MKGVIFTFDTKQEEKKEKTKFYRKLYGYTQTSKFSKYKYEKAGVLSKIPYLKPTESVIIVKKEDAKKVRKFLKNQEVEFSEHIIWLKPKEFKNLRDVKNEISEK